MVYFHTYETQSEQDAERVRTGSDYLEPWLSVVGTELQNKSIVWSDVVAAVKADAANNAPAWNVEPAMIFVMHDGTVMWKYPDEIESFTKISDFLTVTGPSTNSRYNVNVKDVIITKWFPVKTFTGSGFSNTTKFFENINSVYYDSNADLSFLFQEYHNLLGTVEATHTLETVVFGPNCTNIGGWSTFRGCKNIKSVYIPSTLTKIVGGNLFQEVDGIIKVQVNGTTQYGYGLYHGCPNLTRVEFTSNTMNVTSNAYQGRDMFGYCTSLKTLTLPSRMTQIPAQMFQHSGLEELTIPSRVTTIKSGAFFGTKLKELNIPSNVTKIENSAFEDLWDCESITFAEGLTTLGNSCFKYAARLLRFDLPTTLTSIDEYTFYRTSDHDAESEEDGDTTPIQEYADKYLAGPRIFTIPSPSAPTLGKTAFMHGDIIYLSTTAYNEVMATTTPEVGLDSWSNLTTLERWKWLTAHGISIRDIATL